MSSSHAGTHDSTSFQGHAFHSLVTSWKLHQWPVIVAYNAYNNTFNVVTPFSGKNLLQNKYSFKFNHLIGRMTVEQVLEYMLIVSEFNGESLKTSTDNWGDLQTP